MKKIFFNVASGVMFSLALVGCQDDFLNTTPLSEIAESNVWSSAKLAEAAVLKKIFFIIMCTCCKPKFITF